MLKPFVMKVKMRITIYFKITEEDHDTQKQN